MKATVNVAILLFEDVEVLDFAGPFEVFASAKLPEQPEPFRVFTCAERTQSIWAHKELSVNPQFPLHNCPTPDVLVVPGGWGTRQQMNNPRLLEWLRTVAGEAEKVLSVCTGALLLGKAGLLDGLAATTHHEALDLLRQTAPKAVVRESERFIDNGRIVVAAGVTAGIDASLHIVSQLLGRAAAEDTARYIEYDWRVKAR